MDPHDKNNVGECGCERNNISIFGKLSIRQNVFSAKSPIVKMSVRQNDFRQNVRVAVTLLWPSRPSVCLYSVTSCCMFNPCTSLRRSVTLLFILYFCSSIRYDTITIPTLPLFEMAESACSPFCDVLRFAAVTNYNLQAASTF